MMSLPTMSFGDRLCFSKKGGIGEGRWVYPKGANSMACIGRAISALFGINGVRNKQSYLVGLYFQHSRPIFQLWQVGSSRVTYLGIW